MIITIPFKTPSVNHLHNYWRGHVTLSKEARELKKTIAELVPECMTKDKKLYIRIEMFENWICKNGEVSRKDIDNRTKFLIDAVFDALGIDDKYIFEEHIYKIQSETEEKTIMIIEKLSPQYL